MSVLIGPPTGTPFSHHAALSYHETGQLAAYCLAWMPSAETLGALKAVAPLRPMAERLGRRRFEPLADAPLLQGRLGEWRRLLLRAAGRGGEATVRAANEWVARTLRRECRRAAVSAVHAYEDCALLPFEQAKRLGKACIYDLPIGYFEAWERIAPQLSPIRGLDDTGVFVSFRQPGTEARGIGARRPGAGAERVCGRQRARNFSGQKGRAGALRRRPCGLVVS